MKRALATLAVRAAGRPLSVRGRREERREAVVVLGAPLGGDGELTRVGVERVAAAVGLWKRGQAPVVCVTGGLPRGGRAEADALAEWALRAGVPAADLRVDRRSRTTKENAEEAARLLFPENRRRVWVVSQPFHLRRGVFWLRRAGFDAAGWHIDDSLQYRDPVWGLKWVLREYGAWVRLWVLESRRRDRRGG